MPPFRQRGGMCSSTALRYGPLQFQAASHGGFDVDWPIACKDVKPYYDKIDDRTRDVLAMWWRTRDYVKERMKAGEL
jgi:hypothetical protein